MYILNAFSLNMLKRFPTEVYVRELTLGEAREMATEEETPISAVGHASTAAIFADLLGIAVPFARITVELVVRDHALVGQYRGPRLEEGMTVLPEGATIEWYHIDIF